MSNKIEKELTRILIIDDEEDLSYLLSMELSKEGYDIATATTGKEGLELVETFKPTIILLDLFLPDIDGWTMHRTLKNDLKMETVITYIMTADQNPHNLSRSREESVQGIFFKPFESSDLISEIKHVISC